MLSIFQFSPLRVSGTTHKHPSESKWTAHRTSTQTVVVQKQRYDTQMIQIRQGNLRQNNVLGGRSTRESNPHKTAESQSCMSRVKQNKTTYVFRLQKSSSTKFQIIVRTCTWRAPGVCYGRPVNPNLPQPTSEVRGERDRNTISVSSRA